MNWTKEQQQAIDETGTNIIVSAGAGSGKTAVLTARVMRILNSNIHINELLVLTFTKAAAGEMKDRIRKSIKKGLQTNPNLEKELELIDQSYITTFDSYALSIVKKYHYLLNISNDIKITDSSIIKMQESKIMDEVFDYFYQNPTADFTKLIYDFCVKDDTELKKSFIKIAEKIDGLPNRKEYLDNYVSNYFSEEYINEIIKEYENIITSLVNNIINFSKRLNVSSLQGKFTDELNTLLTNLTNCSDLDSYYQTVPTLTIPRLPSKCEEETKKDKEKFAKNIKDLKDLLLKYGNKETIKEHLKLTNDYVNATISIIKEFLNRLHQYKKNNEIYDFQDIALLSIKILKEHEDVRKEIRDSFKEIMIDEYQDTNDIQETFVSLIENNNVYMVGDIKQSIYRFRNANPNIFKNKYDTYSLHNKGLKIDLVQNFRSRMEVLNNINEIFNLVMDNTIGGAEYHESHQMVYGNKEYINEGATNYSYDVEVLEYDNPKPSKYQNNEIEIFTIAKDIKEKIDNKYQVYDKDLKFLRDIKYSDIVILMDRSTDFTLYKKIFEYLGIPMTIYRDDDIKESNDIYILKNIINLIVKINKQEYDSEFKYAYTSIARSYLFSIPDNEILTTFKNNTFQNDIIYNTFAPLANNLSSKTISSLLEDIIAKTNIYEKFIQVGDINVAIIRLSKLFDIADNLSELGYNIYTFKDYLNELLDSEEEMKYKSNNPAANSVKIMTIHTSKGLEYNLCYYSGLYKNFNKRDLNNRFLYSNEHGIVAPFFKEGINDTIIKYLLKYHYLEDEISERIRLFYVALTRAREKMIILSPESEEENESIEFNGTIDLNTRHHYDSFNDILKSIKSKIIKYYHKIDLDSLNLTKNYLYNNKSITNLESKDNLNKIIVEEISIPKTPTLSEEHLSKTIHELITKENKKNMNFGTLVHETLEYIDFINPDYSLIDNSLIKNKIIKFLSNPLLSNIKEANIYKEYEFIYHDEFNEYHGIIDLMLEYQDHIDIIDYKLNNTKDTNYLKQLQGYKDYIKTLTSKDINIYLYSILGESLEKL